MQVICFSAVPEVPVACSCLSPIKTNKSSKVHLGSRILRNQYGGNVHRDRLPHSFFPLKNRCQKPEDQTQGCVFLLEEASCPPALLTSLTQLPAGCSVFNIAPESPVEVSASLEQTDGGGFNRAENQKLKTKTKTHFSKTFKRS